MANKLISVAQVAREFLRAVDVQSERLKRLPTKERSHHRKQIFNNICWTEFEKIGVQPTHLDISDLKSRVGKYMSKAKKEKKLEAERLKEEKEPFKIKPQYYLEAWRLAHYTRRDDELSDP